VSPIALDLGAAERIVGKRAGHLTYQIRFIRDRFLPGDDPSAGRRDQKLAQGKALGQEWRRSRAP